MSQKYDHISPYSTPNNYSRLTRGSSLQDVGPPSSPQGGRRLWRQSSLETAGRRGERGEGGLSYLPQHQQHHQHQHHLHQHQQHHQLDHRRRDRRLGSESGSGRGERPDKQRPIDCNKVTTDQPASQAVTFYCVRSALGSSSVTGRPSVTSPTSRAPG